MQSTINRAKTAIAVLACTTVAFGALLGWQLSMDSRSQANGNFTNEMKIPYAVNLNDGGASALERQGDHPGSLYFSDIDFYNARSTRSLSILSHFKTIQQTTWWSCGISSIMMVLDYYDCLDGWNEETLAALRTDHSAQHEGTCLDQIIGILHKVGGFELETTYDYTDNLEAIDTKWFREHLEAGIPILIGWNDRGAHWQVAIGYDTMNTEYEGDDVLIVADPFDTADHNQDGYGVYGMERFLDRYTFYDLFPQDHQRDRCFVAVKPQGK